jgi:hypothetical protein
VAVPHGRYGSLDRVLGGADLNSSEVKMRRATDALVEFWLPLRCPVRASGPWSST